MKKLSLKEYLIISSMLFGMFFGAGNLIFPVYMGQLAGKSNLLATIGFCVTGVGLPLLGIMAIGLTKSNGLFDASSKVGKWFGYFFTVALYLTIGPLFAIPRTATVSFTTSLVPFVSKGNEQIALFGFTLLFFGAVLYFSLRPSKIMTWIGKYINPIFLGLLFIFVVAVFLKPLGNINTLAPVESYSAHPFFTGLLEGYNTMDALASLAFAIILINAIKGLGISEPKEIAVSTVKAGVISVILMSVIYLALTRIGAQSVFIKGIVENGGIVLNLLAKQYFGVLGNFILAGIMIFACLKTAIGLVTSCSETFVELFPNSIDYKKYAILFTGFSFVISNIGLNKILEISIPVLMFLYPLTIVLILLCICSSLFKNKQAIFTWTIVGTLVYTSVELITKLPVISTFKFLDPIKQILQAMPLSNIAMSWIFPTLIGLVIGILLVLFGNKQEIEIRS